MTFPQGPFNVYFSNQPWTAAGATYYQYNEFYHGDHTRNRWERHGVLDPINFDSTAAATSVMFNHTGINAVTLNSYGVSKLNSIINTGGSWNGFLVASDRVNTMAQWGGTVLINHTPELDLGIT